MDDYISREVAINAANRADDEHVSLNDAARMSAAVVAELEAIPAADVAPVRRGKWVTDEYGNFVCSECRKEPFYDDLGFGYICSDFCPDCGADMREDSHGKAL